MTPRLFLLRHWLACHMLVCLLISGAARAEVGVIERRPVAGGAEVVLMKTGEDREGGNYSLCYRRPDGSQSVLYQANCRQTLDIQCSDKRMSLRLFSGYESIIVTLDVNAEEPRLYEDRFRFTSWGGPDNGLRLLTADELVIYSESDPPDKQKHLLRDESGRWTFQGLPYRKDLHTKVTVFSPEYQQLRVMELPIRFGLAVGIQSSYPITAMPGLYQRLQEVHEVFWHYKHRPSTPVGVVVVDAEMLLPTPQEMAPARLLSGIHPIHEDGLGIWAWFPRLLMPVPRLTVWDLGLSCYHTSYDHAVAELREACMVFKAYSMDLMAYSAPEIDGMAFSALFVHELEKAGF